MMNHPHIKASKSVSAAGARALRALRALALTAGDYGCDSDDTFAEARSLASRVRASEISLGSLLDLAVSERASAETIATIERAIVKAQDRTYEAEGLAREVAEFSDSETETEIRLYVLAYDEEARSDLEGLASLAEILEGDAIALPSETEGEPSSVSVARPSRAGEPSSLSVSETCEIIARGDSLALARSPSLAFSERVDRALAVSRLEALASARARSERFSLRLSRLAIP